MKEMKIYIKAPLSFGHLPEGERKDGSRKTEVGSTKTELSFGNLLTCKSSLPAPLSPCMKGDEISRWLSGLVAGSEGVGIDFNAVGSGDADRFEDEATADLSACEAPDKVGLKAPDKVGLRTPDNVERKGKNEFQNSQFNDVFDFNAVRSNDADRLEDEATADLSACEAPDNVGLRTPDNVERKAPLSYGHLSPSVLRTSPLKGEGNPSVLRTSPLKGRENNIQKGWNNPAGDNTAGNDIPTISPTPLEEVTCRQAGMVETFLPPSPSGEGWGEVPLPPPLWGGREGLPPLWGGREGLSLWGGREGRPPRLPRGGFNSGDFPGAAAITRGTMFNWQFPGISRQ